jgi:hypothetical protein
VNGLQMMARQKVAHAVHCREKRTAG